MTPTLDDLATLVLTTQPDRPEQLRELASSIEQLLEAHPERDDLRAAFSDLPETLNRVADGKAAPIEGDVALIKLSQALEEIMSLPGDSTPRGASGEVAQGDEGGDPTEITLDDDIDEEIVADFITESLDHIEYAEQALLALEAAPNDLEAVNTIFRAFHTIKGGSAFLGLREIERLAHAAETLLSQVRDRTVEFSSQVADLVLQSADLLRALLDGVRVVLAGGAAEIPEAMAPLLEILESGELPQVSDEAPAPATRATIATAAEGTGPTSPAEEETVRIRVNLLDHLVDLVGELVVSHSMLSQEVILSPDRQRVEQIVTRSSKILRELQDLSTSLRMVPLRPVFNRVARVARDAARKNGKEIRLVTSGEDTELDRNMVNALADPLIHMVRNAIDHGIETAAERRASGKDGAGELRIAAYHAGGNVVVEIADDGRGLDREKLLQRARERGIIDSEKGLSDDEVLQLIFAPGFSTAKAVTAISGRGVGMDVVRRAVEDLRGRVEIDSEPGRGTTFEIQLPLTLAITDGILVRVGDERYIIPTIKVQMSYRPAPEAISTIAGKGEMVLLHNQIIPIIRLHRIFDIEPDHLDPASAILVIIRDGGRRCALLVDEVLGQQQFVVKALSSQLTSVEGIAGGAIMGDGTVGLIIDPATLMNGALNTAVRDAKALNTLNGGSGG